MLVVHPDESAVVALAALGDEIEVERVDGGWEALDRIHVAKFDLVISALRLNDMRGVELLRAAVAADPELAERTYLFTTQGTRDTAPPSSALARVLTSPLDPEKIRKILGHSA